MVDDHQMFLEAMQMVFSQQENMEVLFVENDATEVLKKLKKQTPDIIITDISMPKMNGIELIKMIRNEFPYIKILVLSMHKSSYVENIDGYLLKEIDKTELLKAIHTIVLENKKVFTQGYVKEQGLIFKKSILSSREKEIIRLIAQEYTTDEIAEKLFISRHTIETHRKNIFLKLQVKNIAGLIKKAINLGVIE